MHDVFENRVRFAETDQQGVVFYGEYVTFQDEAINGFFRAIDYDYATIRAADWDLHVAHVDLDYHAPARFEDDLVTAARVERIGRSSIAFATETRRRDDGEAVAEGHVVHVAVDEAGETTRVPDDFREAVVAFQDDPPERE